MINTEDQIFGITHLFKRHNEHPFSVEFVLTQNIANDIHNCLYLNEKKKLLNMFILIEIIITNINTKSLHISEMLFIKIIVKYK